MAFNIGHYGAATYRNMSQRLTFQQARAVDLIVEGSRLHDVAAALGVDRVTVWRWRQSAVFEAELNSRRHELWQASVERLRSLVPSALETLEQELAGKGRLRAAEVILRLAGFDEARKGGLGVRPRGPIDPATIEQQRDHQRQFAELLSV